MFSLEGYSFSEKVFESGSTVVYRGTKHENNLPVIAKIIRSEYPHPDELERFVYGYQIVKEFNLPGMIKAYDLENVGHRKAFIMEDIGAISLRDYLKENTIDLKTFLKIAISIVGILESVHKHNIIHKDIKPSNILLIPKTYETRLIDFNFASQVNEDSVLEMNHDKLEGTLAYIAPEQTGRINRAITFQTDLYSLGITLYEVLTGRLPFNYSDRLEMVHAHIAIEPVAPEINSDIPRAISMII
ncbi:serine/threonine protein kinase, partial [bacterium]|nr:serine/threonine protein kinase [bacterium]